MRFVHPSNFVETVVAMDKDFDPAWISEMIVSRVSPVDFPAMISELENHVSSNDPNGAKFAIAEMEKHLATM